MHTVFAVVSDQVTPKRDFIPIRKAILTLNASLVQAINEGGDHFP